MRWKKKKSNVTNVIYIIYICIYIYDDDATIRLVKERERERGEREGERGRRGSTILREVRGGRKRREGKEGGKAY
jgi:hypothetical protein